MAFALVLLTGNASGDDRVGVDPRDCRPASPREVEASGVVPWIGWHRFLASCPLRTALAAPGLTLIAADIRRHDATPPATRTTLPPERPPPVVLMDGTGKVLLSVQVGFPFDPPGESRFFFSDWHDGFPWRVDIQHINDPVFGSYDLLPLVWRPEEGNYQAYFVAGQRK